MPCIVIGAGPSLYEEIDNIKILIEGGAKIIAVDIIFNFLKENGIKPDLTVSADLQGVCAEFFDDKNIEADDRFFLYFLNQ